MNVNSFGLLVRQPSKIGDIQSSRQLPHKKQGRQSLIKLYLGLFLDFHIQAHTCIYQHIYIFNSTHTHTHKQSKKKKRQRKIYECHDPTDWVSPTLFNLKHFTAYHQYSLEMNSLNMDLRNTPSQNHSISSSLDPRVMNCTQLYLEQYLVLNFHSRGVNTVNTMCKTNRLFGESNRASLAV